ncbi:hypothetical protein ACFST9_19890 [Hymenobacter monticola]|uniref:Uncharacterized protein n=1 Tax=Hymenobacter monticola TaxID=1705399 RepID=A0ABY4BA45_9BACT|nr:hypothetical protein [Hymenobacter monticola]UOE34633.1 hypothetical protein MTP16_03020 [Hymenobacter monticola]
MKYNTPFYSISLGKPASEVYHTNPKCRVGQKIEPADRVSGMGDGRRECPFCFVMGQLRTTRLVDMPNPTSSAGQLATKQI